MSLQIKDKLRFFFAIDKKWLLKQQYTKTQLSQKLYWENSKITAQNYQF